MESLEEIKKRKLEQLMQAQQNNVQQQAQEEAQLQSQIEQMESAVKQVLTKDALTRYSSLKVAHPEKAMQLLVLLIQAMQKGQVRNQIDDALLKKILEQITPKKREIKINRV